MVHTIVGMLAAGACLMFGGWPVAGQGTQRNEGEAASVLYLFLTPECREASEAARQAKAFLLGNRGKIRLRTVLLVRDFGRLTRTEDGSPIQRAMKELGELGPLDIPLYDEDGLRLAEQWKVTAVSAFVLVTKGRAHRALGARADLEEVFRCGK